MLILVIGRFDQFICSCYMFCPISTEILVFYKAEVESRFSSFTLAFHCRGRMSLHMGDEEEFAPGPL